MSWVSTPPGYDYYDGEAEADVDGQEGDQNENGDEDYDEETNGGEEGDEGDDEPWLDTPERLRLILGLVAEFTEGIVNKIESEVSLPSDIPPNPSTQSVTDCL